MKKPFALMALVGIFLFLFAVSAAEAALQQHEIHKRIEQGHATIQDLLEGLYPKNDSVPQSKEIIKLWRMAAEKGDAYSQRVLAEMYYYGDGVAQDFVRAYVWMSLAAAQDSYYAEMRDIILKVMTPRQVELAQELSIELQNKIKHRTKENKP